MNYEITNTPCKVTITVCARWNWWAVIGAPVVFVLIWKYHATHSSAGNLSLPFLVLAIGILAFQMLWSLGGREVLCFGQDQLEARCQIMFFSRSQHFPLREISEPFFIPSVTGQGEEKDTPSGIGFDYRGTHYRFLNHLEEPDVAHIVAILRGTFPEIARLWDNPNPQFNKGGITTLGLSSR